MKVLVRITAQYYENYAYFEDVVKWKPKGEMHLEMRVDDDYFINNLQECVEAIKIIVENKNNNKSKLEYHSHELIFHDSISIDEVDFELTIQEILEKKYGKNQSKA